MKLLVEYLRNEISELNANGVVINVLGDITKLPNDVKKKLKKLIELTKNNKG